MDLSPLSISKRDCLLYPNHISHNRSKCQTVKNRVASDLQILAVKAPTLPSAISSQKLENVSLATSASLDTAKAGATALASTLTRTTRIHQLHMQPQRKGNWREQQEPNTKSDSDILLGPPAVPNSHQNPQHTRPDLVSDVFPSAKGLIGGGGLTDLIMFLLCMVSATHIFLGQTGVILTCLFMYSLKVCLCTSNTFFGSSFVSAKRF